MKGRVDRAVAQELKYRTVEVIGSALALDIDLVQAEAVRGRVALGQLIELGNIVQRGAKGRSAEADVLNGGTVYDVALRRAAGTTQANRTSSASADREAASGLIASRIVHGARRQEHQVLKVPAVEREFSDLRPRNQLSNGPIFRI